MVNTDPCPFCLIVEGRDLDARVLYRDSQVVAFFPLDPATAGHTLVIPIRHVTRLEALEQDEARDLADAIQRVATTIMSTLRPAGLNVIQSNGAAATQTVPHVHFHLVPRSEGDRMVLRWPDGASQSPEAQDRTLALLQAHLAAPAAGPSPEDRRQHLSFIQAVITRMAQASAAAKTWLLPIVSATLGYAISKDQAGVALLGAMAIAIFGLLDANYLKQERAFRKLYDEVARGGPIPIFAMNPALAAPQGQKVNYWPDRPDILSWAVLPFYGPLLLTALVIACWLRFH